ncbi:MAG TPA: hypothetical protein VFO40_11680 [Chthoniobacterales bacterium]|nr:hypothetical protein [Chthoniobacterales bacterium]
MKIPFRKRHEPLQALSQAHLYNFLVRASSTPEIDIIGGATPPTFNMTFSLTGDTIPEAGIPGTANCHGQTISALAHQFGSIHAASLATADEVGDRLTLDRKESF